MQHRTSPPCPAPLLPAGTAITWHPGKDLTPTTASADVRPAKPLAPGESFFSWFKVPEVRAEARGHAGSQNDP